MVGQVGKTEGPCSDHKEQLLLHASQYHHRGLQDSGPNVGRSSDFSKTAGNLDSNAKISVLRVSDSFHFFLSLSLSFLDIQEANPVHAKQNKSMVPI